MSLLKHPLYIGQQNKQMIHSSYPLIPIDIEQPIQRMSPGSGHLLDKDPLIDWSHF